MSALIIDGKEIASRIRSQMKSLIIEMKDAHSVVPGLAVILWSNDPASRLYVKNKIKACEDIGMFSAVYEFGLETQLEEVIACIKSLNEDPRIHGIMVQLPIIEKSHETRVLSAISPDKDVDGLHSISAGNLLLDRKGFLPCTPQGILVMLEESGVVIEGMHAVIVGRSNIVGKPISLMLLRKNATVTICHSRTRNLEEHIKKADILIAAVGKPLFIKADMVKAGATVIDVGINRIDKKVVGDVDFDRVKEVAGRITPVPGGVGPLTVTMLLKNTYRSAYEELNKNSCS